MPRAANPQGLITTTHQQATSAMEELIRCCGFPVVWSATPLRVRRHMLQSMPRVAVVWLDRDCDVEAAVQMLIWLGTYEPEVRRIAVAYQLPTELEVSMRCAGAHVYLATEDGIRGGIQHQLAGWLPGAESRQRAPSVLDLDAGALFEQGSLHAWPRCVVPP